MNQIIKKIKTYISMKIGMHEKHIDDNACMRILIARMEALELETVAAYEQYITESNVEFQLFIEGIVNTETWFFRDVGLFSSLIESVIRPRLSKKSKIPVDILFLPCSSGEEPYTLLMAMDKAEIDLSAVNIVALDISLKAIAKAKEGIYDENSFRGKNLQYRNLYFSTLEEQHYRLDRRFTEKVAFLTGNIASSTLPLKPESFDVIVCRNLLMYLHKTAQKKAFEHFYHLLRKDGILILTSVESAIAGRFGYQSHSFRNRGIYYKKNDLTSIVHADARNNIHEIKEPAAPEKKTASPANKESECSLETAQYWADVAEYQKAKSLCLKYLAQHKSSAEAHFLMGVIHHAQGNEERAEDFFQKTVYLNPKHHEALIYLSLLCEKKSDPHQAEIFRQWAERCR